jgi:hypothetical protein
MGVRKCCRARRAETRGPDSWDNWNLTALSRTAGWKRTPGEHKLASLCFSTADARTLVARKLSATWALCCVAAGLTLLITFVLPQWSENMTRGTIGRPPVSLSVCVCMYRIYIYIFILVIICSNEHVFETVCEQGLRGTTAVYRTLAAQTGRPSQGLCSFWRQNDSGLPHSFLKVWIAISWPRRLRRPECEPGYSPPLTGGVRNVSCFEVSHIVGCSTMQSVDVQWWRQ